MPGSARVQYAGAVYHVMCRGDRREAIFRSDADRLLMLETLLETCERTGFLLHSYVLMPNHYHLLLETPEPNLVAGMKWFQGTYTQRFNVRNRLSGHLFQGRCVQGLSSGPHRSVRQWATYRATDHRPPITAPGRDLFRNLFLNYGNRFPIFKK